MSKTPFLYPYFYSLYCLQAPISNLSCLSFFLIMQLLLSYKLYNQKRSSLFLSCSLFYFLVFSFTSLIPFLLLIQIHNCIVTHVIQSASHYRIHFIYSYFLSIKCAYVSSLFTACICRSSRHSILNCSSLFI